jgi:EAL domain-containing protein (putative c-di-GMP-specific phosphodiesterase class I)
MRAVTMLDELSRPGAIRVEYQPIVQVHPDGARLYGFESLSRGPRGTTMERPSVMFEYARRKGAEMEIDRLCIATAIAGAAVLPKDSILSINVHGSTLCNTPRFAAGLIEGALGHGIAPQRLMIEILEHRGAWVMESLQATLQELREAGVRIAVDDLGGGASNFRMFVDCRPDHVKIDRYIVHGCSDDRYRLASLQSIVQLAKACDAVPVAEGVEDAKDLAAVRSLGIDCVQGWHFSRSLPAEEIATSDFLQPKAKDNR